MPILLEIAATAQGPVERVTLGPDLTAGERPQTVVPAHYWQAAQSLGEWSLTGCTVAPGFDFSAFELAPPGTLDCRYSLPTPATPERRS